LGNKKYQFSLKGTTRGYISTNDLDLGTKPTNWLNQFNAHMKFSQGYVSQDKPNV